MNLTERYINDGPVITLISVVPKRALYESGRKKPLGIFKLESISIKKLDEAINYIVRLEDNYWNEIVITFDDKAPGLAQEHYMRVFNLLNREARKAYRKEIKVDLSDLESLLSF